VLEAQDLSGFTPLIVASLKGNAQCVNLVRFWGFFFRFPGLLVVCQCNPVGLTELNVHTGVQLQLLQYGANVNHVGAKPDCSTALHEAVSRGYNKVVDLLLQYGNAQFPIDPQGMHAFLSEAW
jgi:ankyrin repeat protein